MPDITTNEFTSKEWMASGDCGIQENIQLFQEPSGYESPGNKIIREEAAKRICRGCLVLDICREDALSGEYVRIEVQGGMDPDQIRNMVRRRQRNAT